MATAELRGRVVTEPTDLLVPSLPATVEVPQDWDYDASVERVRAGTYRWRDLTAEIFTELLVAREALSRPGHPWGRRTWADYCQDIGVHKATVNRWLAHLTGANAPVKPHIAQASGENEWYTPEPYVEAAREVLGDIDLDPASTEEANAVVGAEQFHSMEDDGLAHDWQGRVWMNPPYAANLVGQFTEKLGEHFEKKEVSAAIVLVNNATETDWFQQLAKRASAICFPERRIRFWSPTSETGAPLQGQAVVYLGEDVEAFVGAYQRFGLIVYVAG